MAEDEHVVHKAFEPGIFRHQMGENSTAEAQVHPQKHGDGRVVVLRGVPREGADRPCTLRIRDKNGFSGIHGIPFAMVALDARFTAQ
jgi:hypothetical protein